MILALESPPLFIKIYLLVTISFVFLVLVDKKVMFRNVLFVERNLCHGKYSRYVTYKESKICNVHRGNSPVKAKFV